MSGPIRPRALAPLALALTLAACAATGGGGDDSAPPSPSASPTPSEDETDGNGDGSMPIGGVSEETIAGLLEAAAEEAGVEVPDITVVSAESVTWPDGSIGCPKPGMMYTQALVPGYRVVLEADGEELHFHAAEGREFFLCENPRPPAAGDR